MMHMQAVNNYNLILRLYSQVQKLMSDLEQREPILQELELAVRFIMIYAIHYFVSRQKDFYFIMTILSNAMLTYYQTCHLRILL